MNAIEVTKKDIFSRERDAASSALFSDFFDNETVGYEIEITDVSSQQPRQSVKSNGNTDVNENAETHVDIVRESSLQQSEILQSKPGLSRRVTGANRVVPLITSLWQKGELKAFEPTVYSAYKAILNNPENTEERLCEICHNEFLSSTEVEAHVREIHRKEYIMPQQCFVCTKMYVFEAQLERHLSISHGIQYPEMICKICFMEFNTAIEKKAHERKHDKIYSCHFCSSKFASEYSWQKHYTEHLIAKKPYQCTKCGKRFCQRICLSLHKRRHGQCWCSLCHSFFKELQFLLHLEHHLPAIQRNFLNSIERMDQEESHLEEVMNTYFRTRISYHDSWKFKDVDQDVSGCVESMINAVSNVLEVDLQPSELPQKNGVECKLCGLEMSSATELLEHCRKSHLRSRTCPFCGKRSRSVSQTFRHMKIHIDKRKLNKGVTQSYNTDINETESVFACQFCNRVYPNKGKLNYHLETIHKMNIVSRPYSCTVCDRKFQHKAARDRHMLLHSKEKNACWKCAVCDQAFLRPKFLLRHVKEHKTENVCPVCNKVFSKQTKLTLHLKSHKPFIPRKRLKCSMCPVTCPSITTLREHIRIHTGERPYSCDQCELKFKRSQALKQHLISIHNGPGSKSNACSLCGVAFKRRGNLMRHILSCHQGVRRFICGLCGHRYAQNQDLRRHLITKHQMQLANNPIMEKKPIQHFIYSR